MIYNNDINYKFKFQRSRWTKFSYKNYHEFYMYRHIDGKKKLQLSPLHSNPKRIMNKILIYIQT